MADHIKILQHLNDVEKEAVATLLQEYLEEEDFKDLAGRLDLPVNGVVRYNLVLVVPVEASYIKAGTTTGSFDSQVQHSIEQFAASKKWTVEDFECDDLELD